MPNAPITPAETQAAADILGFARRAEWAQAVAEHLSDETEFRPVPRDALRGLARQYMERGEEINAMRMEIDRLRDDAKARLAVYEALAARAKAASDVDEYWRIACDLAEEAER